MLFATRNSAIEFARRTRKNLNFLSDASLEGKDVHVVTQLATSLLGLIVFPWEKLFVEQIKALRLDTLTANGWPTWSISLGACDTLGDLVWHLRNAVAHGRLSFSSDSLVIEEVSIIVEDCPRKSSPPNWRAEINGQDLKTFCYMFIDLIEETIG